MSENQQAAEAPRGIPGLRGQDHVGITVPDIDAEIAAGLTLDRTRPVRTAAPPRPHRHTLPLETPPCPSPSTAAAS